MQSMTAVTAFHRNVHDLDLFLLAHSTFQKGFRSFLKTLAFNRISYLPKLNFSQLNHRSLENIQLQQFKASRKFDQPMLYALTTAFCNLGTGMPALVFR